jgi:hypothetical protein
MNRMLPAALAAILALGSSAALAQSTMTEPPTGGQSTPQVGPGERNETGQVESAQQTTEDTNQRVLPEVGADQSAEALTEQTGVVHEAQPGAIVTPAQ